MSRDLDDDEKRLEKTKIRVRGSYKARSFDSSKKGNHVQVHGHFELTNYHEVKPWKDLDYLRSEPGGVTLKVFGQYDDEYNPVERELHVELTADVINEILKFVVKHHILEVSTIKVKEKKTPLHLHQPPSSNDKVLRRTVFCFPH